MKEKTTLFIRDIQRGAADAEPAPSLRPRTRGDCSQRRRPCPFISCRHHLFIEVTPAGSIKMAFGDDIERLTQMEETCSLDVADRGEHDMNRIGRYLGVTPARIQQEVSQALAKLRSAATDQRLELNDMLYEAMTDSDGPLPQDMLMTLDDDFADEDKH